MEQRALDAEQGPGARGPLGVHFGGLAVESDQLVAPEPVRLRGRLRADASCG